MNNIKPDAVVDTRGMSCPLPVLKMKRALEGLQPGEVLELIASDRGTIADVPGLLEKLGHELITVHDSGEILSFHIRKK